MIFMMNFGGSAKEHVNKAGKQKQNLNIARLLRRRVIKEVFIIFLILNIFF